MCSHILEAVPSQSGRSTAYELCKFSCSFEAFTALLQPQDRIMGLGLPDGGHLVSLLRNTT